MSASRIAERSAAYELQTAVKPTFGASFDLLATAAQGIKEIRALILSLAASGRLLAQNTGDEPAGSLLRVLRDEWTRRGEAASKRRIASQTLSVDVQRPTPSGWQYVRLGAVFDMFNGRAFKPTDWQSQGMPIVRIQNLNNPRASYNYCDPTAIQPQHTIFKDTFLISWSGTPGTSFGAFIWTGGTAALNQHIFKCEQVAPVYLPAFLRLAINSQLDVLISRAHGGVGLQHVTKGTLENLSLPLPPFAEQARIVARVDELMQLCDALEAHGRLQDEQHARLVATLFEALAASESTDTLAENWQRIATHFDLLLDRPEAVDALEQTLLQLAVRGLLVPQDSNDELASKLIARIHVEKARLSAAGKMKRGKMLPEVIGEARALDGPRSWCRIHLGEIIELISGQHLTPNEYSEQSGEGIPYLTGPAEFGELSPRPTRWTGTRKAVAVSGDILITVKGSGVGKLNVVDQPEIAISRQLMAIRPIGLLPTFVFLVLQTMYASFQEKSVGIAIPGIGRDDVLNAVFAIPPLAEQGRIVARVEQLRSLCAGLRERLNQARTTQAHLADALVSVAAQSPTC